MVARQGAWRALASMARKVTDSYIYIDLLLSLLMLAMLAMLASSPSVLPLAGYESPLFGEHGENGVDLGGCLASMEKAISTHGKRPYPERTLIVTLTGKVIFLIVRSTHTMTMITFEEPRK
ncbi:hypothetical protein [Streptomyces sp. SID3212]|uniref:hypothetical protein n=1 Tax=Streptomyces sp. SID3212 TaxID=2690259 RepID=UPI00136AE162|nr:hypothetical protein [Streptomyces sp. SID3212]MYV58028.1 hypothetical protein [Streptomyces sp. SID3212]